MTTNRNLFMGATLLALIASTLFTARRNFSRKPQAGWNREQWLRVLSGINDSK